MNVILTIVQTTGHLRGEFDENNRSKEVCVFLKSYKHWRERRRRDHIEI